ncbi:hypothetical protein D9M72_539340 [compost metagenome]
MRPGIGPGLGADQQAVGAAYGAVSIGAQLEALAPMILPPPVVVDAGQVAQAELGALMVGGQLGLDLAFGIVEHQMAAARTVLFPATNASQCMLVRQLPRRHVQSVRHCAHDNRLVRIAAIQEHHKHFAADAGDADLAVLGACPWRCHPDPA